MKKIISSLIVGLVSFTGLGFGYFEDTMVCTVSSSQITVQFRTDSVVGQYCVEYIKNISESLVSVDEDLRAISLYISKNIDKAYRLEIQSNLTTKKAGLLRLRAKFLDAMNLFERDILYKIKKVVNFRFRKVHENYISNIASLQTILKNQIEKGELEDFANYTNQLSDYIYKKNILDNVFKAQNLQEIIPFLQQYLLITKQPLGRSGSLLLQ